MVMMMVTMASGTLKSLFFSRLPKYLLTAPSQTPHSLANIFRLPFYVLYMLCGVGRASELFGMHNKRKRTRYNGIFDGLNYLETEFVGQCENPFVMNIYCVRAKCGVGPHLFVVFFDIPFNWIEFDSEFAILGTVWSWGGGARWV